MLRTSWVQMGVTFALAVVPCSATAQTSQPPPPSPSASGDRPERSPIDAARTCFEEGLAHMAQNRWQEAATAFATSMQIRATASAALNLGISLQHLGRLVEARLRFQQFQEMASDTLRREHGDHVQELLLQIARDLARVRIIELTPTLAAVSIDGRRVQPNEAGEVVVDPGTHLVRAEATGFVPFEERVELSPGSTRELRIVMRLDPSAGVQPTVNQRLVVVNQSAPEARPLHHQWWFWTLLGVGVAGAVTGVVLAMRSTVRDPPPTSTGVTLMGLSLGGAW